MRPPALGATTIPLMRAWACGLRTKATSCVRGSCTSETNCPRPRKWRASSLRRSDAPTPEVVFATARVMRLSLVRCTGECGPIANIPSLHRCLVNTRRRDSAFGLGSQAMPDGRSRGRVVHAAFFPVGGVELRRHRAAIDLARTVERQRGDDVDKTGMRIDRPFAQAVGL